MTTVIVLDSGPLGLLVHRRGVAPADACRKWLQTKEAAGVQVVVPEIVDYEIRRELLRLNRSKAIRHLDTLLAAAQDRLLPVTSASLRLAANLWAQARRRGTPTADPHAIDVDVILAAQVLTSGLPMSDLVVATSNVSHLTQFVPAQEWSTI